MTEDRTGSPPPQRPSAAQLAAAGGRTVPDIIAPDLRVLFCGINPGLYSAAVGHHFARAGNRFWPALHAGGFTPRLFRPDEGAALLALGQGITNVVDRASAAADELSSDELRAGAAALDAKVRKFRPRFLAILGVGAYRTGFARPTAIVGPQPETIGDTRLWVVPNPSGLNAHYHARDLAVMFGKLHDAAVIS